MLDSPGSHRPFLSRTCSSRFVGASGLQSTLPRCSLSRPGAPGHPLSVLIVPLAEPLHREPKHSSVRTLESSMQSQVRLGAGDQGSLLTTLLPSLPTAQLSCQFLSVSSLPASASRSLRAYPLPVCLPTWLRLGDPRHLPGYGIGIDRFDRFDRSIFREPGGGISYWDQNLPPVFAAPWGGSRSPGASIPSVTFYFSLFKTFRRNPGPRGLDALVGLLRPLWECVSVCVCVCV
ncbi:uncharacterized protein LOC114045295 [Vombatus ursinus]|uniref:uncharacterized protein LOC114045295 n=1 Tax=Vombatus ursinus TaxID=29139 RepID=UPI000FFD88EC|nr:uncharacterized protein LOC114045295 [Vombatus ursinus]